MKVIGKVIVVTRGGSRIARILKGDGTPFKGLYAVGNNSVSVMGNAYPRAGSTIGPSMTLGYIAAKHLTDGKIRPNH